MALNDRHNESMYGLETFLVLQHTTVYEFNLSCILDYAEPDSSKCFSMVNEWVEEFLCQLLSEVEGKSDY